VKSRLFAFSLFLLLFLSCAPKGYPPPQKIPARPHPSAYPAPKNPILYEKGKEAFQKERTIEALENLERFVRLNPSSSLTDDALFLMGEIYLKRDNPYEALRYFQRIAQKFPGSNVLGEALYGEAYCWYKLKDFKPSEQALDRLFSFPSLPDSLYIRAETLRGHLCVLEKKIRCGMEAYLSARSRSTNPTELSVLDAFIEKVIFEIRDPNQLRTLIEAHARDIAGDAARVRLAEVLTEQKAYKKAKALLPELFVSGLPDPLRQKAETVLETLHRAFIRKVVLGCLLPLTGPRAPFGLRALKGILQATEAFEVRPHDIDVTLLIRDTAGKPSVAGTMAKELVTAGHVQGIVGPMFLDTTRAAAEAIQSTPVPLISLSQAEGVPQLGPYVFRNCLTPAQQVETLAKFLIDTLKLRTAAILYPRNPFGMRYMKRFWEVFVKDGGEIRGAESYLPTDTDFGTPIKKLVGLYDTKERWERGDTPDEKGKFPPVIDFKVLFIPDIYNRVVLIAPQLAFYDVEGITLAGINTWNDPELIKEGRQYVRGAIFTDGFFPGSESPVVQKFVGGFRTLFGETPEILAAQAYDATHFFICAFKKSPGDDREKLVEAMEHDTGYHGVSGLRYFDETGEAVRDVLILTVTRRRIVPVPVTALPDSP